MKKSAVIFSFLCFVCFAHTQAQSFKIGIGGGASISQSPGYFEDYDMSVGFNAGIKAKLGLPLSPFTITGQINYTRFNGKTEGRFLNSQLPGEIETNSYLLMMGAGLELNVLPGPIAPYLGADIFYADFVNFNSHSGMGLGLGAGADFKLVPMFDIDIAAKYNFYNLIGKEDGDDDLNAIALTANFMFGF